MNEMSFTFNFKVGEQYANNNGYTVEVIGFAGEYIQTKNENELEENFDLRQFIGEFYLIGWI